MHGDNGSRGRGTTIKTRNRPPEFTDEQEQLYQKQYNEGYNLIVEFHHPESSLHSDSLSESNKEEISLSGYFSDIALVIGIFEEGQRGA